MRNTAVAPTPPSPRRRADVYCAVSALLLVAAAFTVPRIMGKQWQDHLYAGAAPIFGNWLPHVSWGTAAAVVLALAVIGYGPDLSRRLPWRRLLLVAWSAAAAWAFALAMADGWQRGFAGRLTTHDEYLHEVGGVRDIPAMLRGFSDRILDFQPDSWTTHVSGHPPGALLSFVLLDRLGLGGGGWAALLCLLVGASTAAAVPVAIRALGSEDRARAAVPFLVLAPAAIWIAVSADALFAGVTAWAVAFLAIATRRDRHWALWGLAAGLAFGYGLYLSYGLVLMAVPAAAVLLARTFRPIAPAAVGVLLVVAAFTAAGFWWPDGYQLVVERYYQGIASERPFSYWVWGNLAATICVVGLASAAALHRVVGGLRIREPLRALRTVPGEGHSPGITPGTVRSNASPATEHGDANPGEPDRTRASSPIESTADARIGEPLRSEHSSTATRVRDLTDEAVGQRNPGTARSRTPLRVSRATLSAALQSWRATVDPAALLAVAGVVAVLAANLSGLSKAETERIWLPFDVWILAGTALLPRRDIRLWLAVQAVGTLLVSHLILTNW
ncbi:hypothetical protein [Nocardia jejuensis]|uniref:hypothetical protein n=1 Tax=Nocardia jejuensis TaxID=328049 RepID=UPI000829C721|nr:hypothetical protein [Nocardia jejuensis]